MYMPTLYKVPHYIILDCWHHNYHPSKRPLLFSLAKQHACPVHLTSYFTFIIILRWCLLFSFTESLRDLSKGSTRMQTNHNLISKLALTIHNNPESHLLGLSSKSQTSQIVISQSWLSCECSGLKFLSYTGEFLSSEIHSGFPSFDRT